MKEFNRVMLTFDMVKNTKKSNIAAISLTAGGGMGTPGQIIVFMRDRENVLMAEGNHAYGDIDLKAIDALLQCFDKNNTAWEEFYMGCGNSLFVNVADFPAIAEAFAGKDTDEVGMFFYDTIYKALSEGIKGQKGIKRSNKEIAAETMQIINDGGYTVNGERIAFEFEKSWLEEVELFPPDVVEDIVDNDDGYLDNRNIEYERCEFRVVNMDSFEANRQYALSDRALVMNFASARHPGGGFLNGASAQEESLCRNSTLYASIGSRKAREMYDYNEEDNDPFYSDYMLISPYVTVFRDPSGELTADCFNTAVVTVPAVNMKRLRKGAEIERVPYIMVNRIEAMLGAAIREEYSTLILGAWGCGVFGHDAKEVAGYFKDVLVNEEYYKYFSKIIFAVYDTSKTKYNYNSFIEVFGEQGIWENTDCYSEIEEAISLCEDEKRRSLMSEVLFYCRELSMQLPPGFPDEITNEDMKHFIEVWDEFDPMPELK